ncbi:NAD(P)-binding protein [Calocera viscosa TUFC12733]|uniref:NAD(P)-binding protein n=1 Tax=Calocera viscosa (strain TUFC12733) TaxID=1330018 RepID=A0A167I7P4_CALVF|nr:NAD(P)-binding protein [Calocera viscosa TUFC12733]
MSPTVYLVSGANRGIGLELIAQLAARENVVVFAGARNPSTATALRALESKSPSKVHVVKLTSADEADNKAAVAKVKQVAGRLDVVIANAGVFGNRDAALLSEKASLDIMRGTFEVNVLGPLVLFQAAWQLLKASTDSPKFIVVSSLAGSIQVGTSFPIPILPYGTSKAAVNWFTTKLHYEYPSLIAVSLHPGSVETDMSTSAKEYIPEMAKFEMITPEESIKGVLGVIDAAKRDEEAGPKFLSYDGSVLPW